MAERALTANGESGKRIRRRDQQTRFLSQSVILEEAGTPALIRMAMIVVCLSIVGFVIWASITDVAEIAVTKGEVVPTGQVQSIQHLEGGIIAAILVTGGNVVEPGQTLVRLDPAAALAELDQTRARHASLQLQAERLEALAAGRKPNFSPAGDGYKELAADQLAIYEGSVNAAASRRTVLLDQRDQKRAELAIFDEQIKTSKSNIEILEEEYKLREDLVKEGLSAKGVFLSLKRELNQTKGDLAKLINQRAQAKQELAEVKSRLAELATDQRETTLAEAGVLGGELAQVRDIIRRLEDRVRRLDVRAPVRGIVKGLQVHTVGGVLPPGGTLLEIVPLGKKLIVETRIATRDVGHVSLGQPVTVKVDSFDFTTYGVITGELKDISATTFLDENGNPYYKGIIALDQDYVGSNPDLNNVAPGMTVLADIHTGTKTLLEYLLKPIYTSINPAFRER